MAESGIDLGFDLSALLNDEEFDIENAIDFNDLLGTPKNQEYYELTSKTLPTMESAPNLKTATPQTRTQLKLQLMRDHSILEQQRATAAKQQQQQQQQPSKQPLPAPIKVPVQSLSLDVPPQVLEVRTKLENPTRYHVMQKQKSQVKQYLSESFQGPSHSSFLSSCAFPSKPFQTHSAPPVNANVPVHQQNSHQSSFTSLHAQNSQLNGNPNASINGQPNSLGYQSQSHQYQQHHQASPSYEIPALSPALSSGATSTSEECKLPLNVPLYKTSLEKRKPQNMVLKR